MKNGGKILNVRNAIIQCKQNVFSVQYVIHVSPKMRSMTLSRSIWISVSIWSKIRFLKALCDTQINIIVQSWELKYEFCNKSFRKDEPLTSWTLFQHICPHFWVGLLNAKVRTNMLKKWSEVHLSEMTCYKIHTLVYFWGSK